MRQYLKGITHVRLLNTIVAMHSDTICHHCNDLLCDGIVSLTDKTLSHRQFNLLIHLWRGTDWKGKPVIIPIYEVTGKYINMIKSTISSKKMDPPDYCDFS